MPPSSKRNRLVFAVRDNNLTKTKTSDVAPVVAVRHLLCSVCHFPATFCHYYRIICFSFAIHLVQLKNWILTVKPTLIRPINHLNDKVVSSCGYVADELYVTINISVNIWCRKVWLFNGIDETLTDSIHLDCVFFFSGVPGVLLFIEDFCATECFFSRS